jgi:hypothetical protein
MKSILICACLLLVPRAFAAGDERSCQGPLTTWVTDVEKRQFIAKIVENSGSDKKFHHLDAGNVGLHAYLLPSNRVAFAFAVAKQIPGGQQVAELMHDFDPSKHQLVVVIETNDEPLLTFTRFTKGEAKALANRHALNTVDVTEDNILLKYLVPKAWDLDGDYDGFHVLYEIVRDAEELGLPRRRDVSSDWTIENYKRRE